MTNIVDSLVVPYTLSYLLPVLGAYTEVHIRDAHSTSRQRLKVVASYELTQPRKIVLKVRVWKNADLSKVVTVRPDGRESGLPLIGDVPAAGFTVAHVQQEDHKRY